MKKLIFILFIFSMFLLPSVVYASDESIPPEVDQSWLAEYYEENIKPQLATLIVASIGAFGGVGGIITFAFRYIKKNTKNAIDSLKINKEERDRLNEWNEKIFNTVENMVKEKLEPFIKQVDTLLEENKHLAEENQKLTEHIQEQYKVVNNKLDDTIKVLRIAFINDEGLVKRGQATQIKRVIGNGKN